MRRPISRDGMDRGGCRMQDPMLTRSNRNGNELAGPPGPGTGMSLGRISFQDAKRKEKKIPSSVSFFFQFCKLAVKFVSDLKISQAQVPRHRQGGLQLLIRGPIIAL